MLLYLQFDDRNGTCDHSLCGNKEIKFVFSGPTSNTSVRNCLKSPNADLATASQTNRGGSGTSKDEELHDTLLNKTKDMLFVDEDFCEENVGFLSNTRKDIKSKTINRAEPHTVSSMHNNVCVMLPYILLYY